MVMEAVPSPQCVGREFVRQYYTLLNKAPLHLHRFYNHDSSFVHGGLKDRVTEEVYGQQQIHQKIMELDFHDCKAKILLVDSHRTLENGVVVQVSGELSNNGQPMRRFVQTFVLAPQSAKKYYVRNDIFRYQDDIFSEEEDGNDGERADIETDHESLQQTCATAEDVKQSHPLPPVAASTVETNSGINHMATGINGTNHIEEEVSSRATPAGSASYPGTHLQQTEAAVTTIVPVAIPTTTDLPLVPTSPNEISEAEVEPEIPTNVDIPAGKSVAETNTAAPTTAPEPKTYANLLKTPSPFNGTVPPPNIPPFGTTRNTPNTSIQTTDTGAPMNAVNGAEGPSPALPPHQQRQNFRSSRPPGIGNGRMGSNSGSYNRERDREKVERDRGDRAPSRESTEEFGEWKQQNGEGNREREREFRRYDDNVQVFVGNIPHFATEEDLGELFEQFGKVIEVRIHGKNTRTQNGARAPFYGFVVFDSAEAAEAALTKKPLLLNGDHRLNVEQKRRGGMSNQSGSREQRGGPMNRGGNIPGGPGRGGRPGGPVGLGPRDSGRGMSGGRGYNRR